MSDRSTAEMCALIRSVESRRPTGNRVLEDPFARHFVRSPLYRVLFARRSVAMSAARLYDSLFSGWAAEIILRYRHSDEVIRREIEAGCTQVVVLGAGYDSTALRFPDSEGVTFYEVDKSGIQQHKIDILRQESLQPKPHVEYVSCDFESEDFTEKLAACGFDPGKRTVVSWLGVTYYLTEKSVRDTLQKLASTCASGSKVVFDYIEPSVVDRTIEHSGAQRGARFAKKRGEPFAFGVERGDLSNILPADGTFRLVKSHTVPELRDLYTSPEDFWLAVSGFIGVIEIERT